MKILIEHYQTKRALEGNGFNLCGSKTDLRRIGEEILRQTEEGFSYGWIKIRDSLPDEHILPDNPAIPWGEPNGCTHHSISVKESGTRVCRDCGRVVS